MPIVISEEIIAAPLAMAPRLAAAQALARSEPIFADFVQRSVRMLARERKHGPNLDDPEGVALHLVAYHHAASWFPPQGLRLGLGRGFPEGISRIPAERWLADSASLRTRYPLLYIDVTHAAGLCDRLSPTLEGIQALTLVGGRLTDDDVRALFSHPAAAGLVWLDLSGNQLGFESLEVLARTAPRLRWLGFEQNTIPNPTIQWVDWDGMLVPESAGDTRRARERCGPVAWLERPPFETSHDPELYYPIPDLDLLEIDRDGHEKIR